MVGTPEEYDSDMMGEMQSGNLVEREAGRDKFVKATLIAKHGERRDPGEAIPSLAELPAPTAQGVETNSDNDPTAPAAQSVETNCDNDPTPPAAQSMETNRDNDPTAPTVQGAETNRNNEGRDQGEVITTLAELPAPAAHGVETNRDIDITGPTARCVQINCLNERLEGEEKFVAVDVPATDDRFRCIPTEFSMSMGLPLIVYVSVDMSDRTQDLSGLMNRTGAYFYRPVNPEKPNFGFYTVWEQTMMSVGTVLVMRHDKKDITVKQVEAIAHYIRYHWDEEYRLLTRMACNKKERKVLRRQRRAFLEDKLSRAAFETFFASFKQSRGYGDRSWYREKSPYEV
jgi:hypothetical protein